MNRAMRLRTIVAGPSWGGQPGTVVTVPEEEAAPFIEGGYADDLGLVAEDEGEPTEDRTEAPPEDEAPSPPENTSTAPPEKATPRSRQGR